MASKRNTFFSIVVSCSLRSDWTTSRQLFRNSAQMKKWHEWVRACLIACKLCRVVRSSILTARVKACLFLCLGRQQGPKIFIGRGQVIVPDLRAPVVEDYRKSTWCNGIQVFLCHRRLITDLIIELTCPGEPLGADLHSFIRVKDLLRLDSFKR